MGKKVFISYKYLDSDVFPLNGNEKTICRDYVNTLQDLLEETPHVYKAEEDDNDLSQFQDDTIASKLRDKIFNSSITVVLISKNMKTNEPEGDQWVPWEISYSLSEYKRNNRASLTNGVIAVVVPDKTGSYEYMITENDACNSRTIHISKLFTILKKNMFNKKEKSFRECNGSKIHTGNPSYIQIVKWDTFIKSLDFYLDKASELNDNIADYKITKSV